MILIFLQIIWVLTAALLSVFLLYIIYVFFKSIIVHSSINEKKSSFELPPVSIIIACYNEERHIENKICELLDESQWINDSEIIVVSNGSTDLTNQILEQFDSDQRVRCFYKGFTSKIKSVNFAVKQARNEILIFNDCRQQLSQNGIKEIAISLLKQGSGVVSALIQDHRFSIRSITNAFALAESKFGNAHYVTGAFYAQYKCDFQSIPEELLFDDLFVMVKTLANNQPVTVQKNIFIKDVSFEKYYQKERIERLIRGLLIFGTSSFFKINRLSSSEKLKTFLYKYLKVLLPIPITLFIVSTGVLYAKNYWGFLLLFVVIILLNKSLRKFTFHCSNFMFFTFCSSYKFFVKSQRSNQWEKLKV